MQTFLEHGVRPWELHGLGMIDLWTMTSIVWPNDQRLEMARQQHGTREELDEGAVPDDVQDTFAF